MSMKQGFFKILSGGIFLSSIIFGAQTFAASSVVDIGFNTGVPVGLNWGKTNTSLVQDDGKIIIGGAFESYKGKLSRSLVRVYADGSLDASFAIGIGFKKGVNQGIVRTVATQSDGKIVVGGDFTSYQGQTANNIIRLNADGTRDNSFDIGNGFDDQVFSIKVLSDGKILVGGRFYNYNGDNVNSIIRLNTDGTRDTSFDVGSNVDGGINSLAIQDDGKIVAGAYWLTTDNRNNSDQKIARFNSDGSLDTGFNNGSLTDFDGSIETVQLQSDGKIIVGGDFTSYMGQTTNHIMRLNADGTRDNSFDIGNGFNNLVKYVSTQPDGKIIAGGNFTSYNGDTTQKFIVRLNSNGTADTSFDVSALRNATSNFATIQADGKILTSKYDGGAGIIRLNANGSTDTSFDVGNGLNSAVDSVYPLSDGTILISGPSEYNNQVLPKRMFKLHADGTIDSSFNLPAEISSFAKPIAIQTDSKILILSDGVALTRLNNDGSEDTSFSKSYTDYSKVNGAKILSDGKIVVYGSFTTYSGTSANGIVKLNSDGSLDGSFNADLSGSIAQYDIYSIDIQADGKIVAIGRFIDGMGMPLQNIIRFNTDGTIDASFLDKFTENRINIQMYKTIIQDDGKIIVGGYFTSYDSQSTKSIVRLNSDGSIDTSFVSGNGFVNGIVRSLSLYSGQIVVGGQFATYNNQTANNIILLNNDGSIDTSFNPGVGFDNVVDNIRIQSGGKLFVGGNFKNYQGATAGFLISLYGFSPIVDIPNSNDNLTVNSAFTTKGYTENQDGTLAGSNPISLADTVGIMPISLDILSNSIRIEIPKDIQFEDNNTSNNYSGVISMPSLKDISSVNDKTVITAFSVGDNTTRINLVNGATNILVPIPGSDLGDYVDIYYSDDNGVSWSFEETSVVINNNGTPSVEFTTNHLATFAITESTYVEPDTTAPIATISYNITTTTSSNVIATLSLNETGTITNNNGNNTYTFGSNGTFTFTFQDLAGNTGSATATVTWISTSSNGGGGGGGRSQSSSVTTIIDKVGEGTGVQERIGSIKDSRYPTETNNAYLWAYKMKITSMETIQKANIDGNVYRSHLAKMLSEYAINELKKTPNTGLNCTFTDMTGQPTELQTYAITACQLGLMGLKADGTPDTKFNPTGEVTRAQFGTTLSRLLYGTTNNQVVGGERYTAHLQALKNAGIMTKINTPTMDEIRGNVFLMLMRAANK